MYKEGMERIEDEFDIVKIVRTIRSVNILSKRYTKLDKITQYRLDNAREHAIILDTDSISESDEPDKLIAAPMVVHHHSNDR